MNRLPWVELRHDHRQHVRTMKFLHQRHKQPTQLTRARELVIALPPMRSNVNLSRIVRAAGCCGIVRIVACGAAKVDKKIARDGAENVQIESRRSLVPALQKLQGDGYALVGLEQTTNSHSLYEFEFPRRCVLVIGNERDGLSNDVLQILDAVTEIPMYGMPYSHNAATSAAIAMYEYCRQYPEG